MDPAVYAVEAAVEATHWWFLGRRRLIARLLRGIAPTPRVRILDVGSGTGTNLRLLAQLGYPGVIGLDPSEEAVRFCAQKGLGPVRRGDLCALPFEDGSFDIVLATDVLEHVPDDVRALSELYRVLAPRGHAIVTVPAFRFLWGRQDDVSHHLRRYTKSELVKRAGRAGFRVLESTYFNYLLMVPIWAARRLMRALRVEVASENQINTAWINRILYLIFDLDVRSASAVRPPFGVSLLVRLLKSGSPRRPEPLG
jgi:SAM-dependent methyltransferase